MIGEDRAVAKVIACVPPWSKGPSLCQQGTAEDAGEGRTGTLPAAPAAGAPQDWMETHTEGSLFLLDNSKYQRDSSIQMGIQVFFFLIKNVTG